MSARWGRLFGHREAAPVSRLLAPPQAREVIPPGYAPPSASLASAPVAEASTETFHAAPHATFGEWNTEAARQEVASIFGPDAHGVATPDTLAAIQAQAAEQAAIVAETRRLAELEEQDRTSSDLPLNRPYTSWGDWDQPLTLEMPPVTTDAWGFGGDSGDLRNLPAFREAVSRRTRNGARECLCTAEADGERRNTQVPGGTWGSRMVCAAGHILRPDLSATAFVWPAAAACDETRVDLTPLPAGSEAA